MVEIKVWTGKLVLGPETDKFPALRPLKTTVQEFECGMGLDVARKMPNLVPESVYWEGLEEPKRSFLR